MNGLGLVLAGGGGKGAYQIGVWRALLEFGVAENITAVSGTSVGALNGALFAQGDYSVAENVWLSISNEQILKYDFKQFQKQLEEAISSIGVVRDLDIARLLLLNMSKKKNSGLFSREGLLEIIDRALDTQYLSSSVIPCYATCLEMPILKKTRFNLQGMSSADIKTVLLATSAIPFIFDEEKIDGKCYIDGGVPSVGDNVPIEPLYHMGIRTFIVAHLSRDYIIDEDLYPDARILQIVPSDHQGDLFDGTLDFSLRGAKKRIEQGYWDTHKVLKPMYDMGLTQLSINAKLNEIAEDEASFSERRRESVSIRDELKNRITNISFKREE